METKELRKNNLNLDVPEITIDEANAEFTLYPKVVMNVEGNTLKILSYVITDNGYMVPVRKDLFNKPLTTKNIIRFMIEFEEFAISIIENFIGFAEFEGKPNYIVDDGTVLSIRKIAHYKCNRYEE